MTAVAIDDLTPDELRTVFPSALATVTRAFEELRDELPTAPESLAAFVRLVGNFDDWFRSRLEGALDAAEAAGEVGEYGSLVSWSGGGYPGSTVEVEGRTAGCGRGCCSPESRHVSIPWDWVAMPLGTLKAFFVSRKEAQALGKALPAHPGAVTPHRSRL